MTDSLDDSDLALVRRIALPIVEIERTKPFERILVTPIWKVYRTDLEKIYHRILDMESNQVSKIVNPQIVMSTKDYSELGFKSIAKLEESDLPDLVMHTIDRSFSVVEDGRGVAIEATYSTPETEAASSDIQAILMERTNIVLV